MGSDTMFEVFTFSRLSNKVEIPLRMLYEPFFFDLVTSFGLGIRTRRRRQGADTRAADQTHMRSRTIARMRCRT